MGVEIPVGYGQAVYAFSLEGSAHVATFTMGINPDPTLDATEAAEAAEDALAQSGSLVVAATLIEGWAYESTTVTMMDETGPLLGVASNRVAGTGVAESMPPNVAILVTKRTARGGRKGKGRFYLPPFKPSEAGVDGAGFIDGGDRAVLQTATDNYFANMVTNLVIPVLLHEDGTLPNVITSLTVESQVATQRRRLR